MPNNPIVPLILCGGSGTRLWPVSRESYPKQFLSIKKKNEFSLLQQTIQRGDGFRRVRGVLREGRDTLFLGRDFCGVEG